MAVEWSADTDARLATLGQRIEDAMARSHVPGVAVGLLHEGREYAAGFGVTNVNHALPVDTDTLFQIGSITKTFTATLALLLVERGVLALDEPVRTYLPDLRLADEGTAARVTMRHLLTHTAGWEGDFFEDTGDGDDALTRVVARMAELPQVLPLGEVVSYNNAGFYLAGRIIEVLVGMPFEQAMRTMLLDPLGLHRSFFFAKEVITDRVAVGHDLQDGALQVLRDWAWPRCATPAGGLIASVGDLVRYARFQLGDGTTVEGARLLAPAVLATMQAPQVRMAEQEWRGLPWRLSDATGERTVSHNGLTNGQASLLLLVPTRRFAIAVLTNAGSRSNLASEISKWTLETLLDLHESQPEPEPLAADTAAWLAGRYSSRLYDIELCLAEEVLQLTLIFTRGFPRAQSPIKPPLPPAPVLQVGPDALQVMDGGLKGARVEILRQQDGTMLGLRMLSRLFVRRE